MNNAVLVTEEECVDLAVERTREEAACDCGSTCGSTWSEHLATLEANLVSMLENAAVGQ